VTTPLTIALELGPEQVEALAQRVAEIVAERHRPPDPPDLLSVEEVAEILRSSKKRVYRMTSDGRLQKVKDGGRVLVPRSEVERHLGGEPAEVTRVHEERAVGRPRGRGRKARQQADNRQTTGRPQAGRRVQNRPRTGIRNRGCQEVDTRQEVGDIQGVFLYSGVPVP
jgi:excisionase family DNA binding protein